MNQAVNRAEVSQERERQASDVRQLELFSLKREFEDNQPDNECVGGDRPLNHTTHEHQGSVAVCRGKYLKVGALGVAVLLAGGMLAMPSIGGIAGSQSPNLFAATFSRFLSPQSHAVDSSLDTVLTVDAIELEAADSFLVSRQYAGEVVAGRTSELGFERSGELVWVGVDRGDRVEAGQILARLDTRQLQAQRSQLIAQRDQAQALLRELEAGPRQEDIAAARSQVQDLEDQLRLARIQQQRREFLYEEGAISRDQLDEVAFGADALQDRLATTQSQLDELLAGTRAEQLDAQRSVVRQISARIEDMDIAIEKGSLIAPFSGVIAARRMDEGTVVDGGQSVMRLVEQSRTEIEVGVPVDTLGAMPVGSEQSVQVGGKTYTATVTAILPEVDEITRTRQVILSLEGERPLAPGQIAELAIAQSQPEQGYWLPTSALVPGDRGLWACYVLVEVEKAPNEPDNPASVSLYEVQRRDVEILHTEGDRSFVRGMVQSGDRVVTDGTQRLVPGQLVQLSQS